MRITLVLTAFLLALPSGSRAQSTDETPAGGIDEDRLIDLIEEVTSDGATTGRNRMLACPDEDLYTAVLISEAISRRSVSVDFDGTPLADAVAFLADVTGLNMVLSPGVRERAEADDLPITMRLSNVTVRNCLELVLTLAGDDLVYTVRHGVLWIALDEEVDSAVILRIYPIDDIVHTPPDFPGPHLDLPAPPSR